jgi:hypothetical protein
LEPVSTSEEQAFFHFVVPERQRNTDFPLFCDSKHSFLFSHFSTAQQPVSAPTLHQQCSSQTLRLRPSDVSLLHSAKSLPSDYSSILHDYDSTPKCKIEANPHSPFGRSPACRGDDTIYTKTVNGHTMFLLFWVDDILLSFDDASRRDMQLFKTAFMTRFDATDEGPVTQFLGIDVDYNREGGTLKISQQSTIDALLYECNMSDCNSTHAPMPAGQILLASDRDLYQNPRITKDYQSRVGTLLWLVSSTRPDMAFTVHQLSKHLIAPGPKHLQALTQALRYLKGKSTMGITYTRSAINADVLIAAADADWATDPETRKSISGQIILMNGGALFWSCRRQGGIAGSTTEAEWIAASHLANTLVWMRRLVAGLGNPQSIPTPVFEDNRACRMSSENSRLGNRLRHIDISMHNVAEHVRNGTVRLYDCPSADNFADVLTKALPISDFCRHRDVIMGSAQRTTPAFSLYYDASPHGFPSWGGVRTMISLADHKSPSLSHDSISGGTRWVLASIH